MLFIVSLQDPGHKVSTNRASLFSGQWTPLLSTFAEVSIGPWTIKEGLSFHSNWAWMHLFCFVLSESWNLHSNFWNVWLSLSVSLGHVALNPDVKMHCMGTVTLKWFHLTGSYRKSSDANNSLLFLFLVLQVCWDWGKLISHFL